MRTSLFPAGWLALALAAALAAAPALAERPDHAGGGKKAHQQERKADKQERKADRHERKADKRERGDDDRRSDARQYRQQREARQGAYFDDRDRESVRRYYTSRAGKGCPPGLAKKNNGCMPPGQAKKWRVGHAMPADVVIYAVPQPILVMLPPPPPRHRYVRVAGDILLIAVGSQMVVDGISGLLN